MFRRDKDMKLDNEGMRRMREAIRQRTDQEGDAPDDQDAAEESSYRAGSLSSPLDDSYGTIQPFDADAAPAQEFSWSRGERGVTPVEAPSLGRGEEPTWSTPAAPAAPSAPAAPAHTTVAADTQWHGTLRSSAPIRIEGQFEGEIDTEDELHVAADANVDATVRARTVTVAGQLKGRIECRERLEILATGRVTGQIDAGRFVVHEGAFLGGQVRMTSATRDGDEASRGDDGQRPLLQRVR